MNDEKFEEIVKKALEQAKMEFLSFAKKFGDGDVSKFDGLWKIPVIIFEKSKDNPEKIEAYLEKIGNKEELLKKFEEYTVEEEIDGDETLLEKFQDFIIGEVGKEDGCFIILNKFIEYVELQKLLSNGNVNSDAFIILSKEVLKCQYEDFMLANAEKGNPRNQKEIDKIFFDYVKSVITHELCHANARYLISEGIGLELDEVNGAQITLEEENEIYNNEGKILGTDLDKNPLCFNFYEIYNNRNEVLIDTLVSMINNYPEGVPIQNCLADIIKQRNGKSQYDDFTDLDVLTMYALFPEELTKWSLQGAYEYSQNGTRTNKLQQLLREVCGIEIFEKNLSLFKEKVKIYISQNRGKLSQLQIEMLKDLGFEIGEISLQKINESVKKHNEEKNYDEII